MPYVTGTPLANVSSSHGRSGKSLMSGPQGGHQTPQSWKLVILAEPVSGPVYKRADGIGMGLSHGEHPQDTALPRTLALSSLDTSRELQLPPGLAGQRQQTWCVREDDVASPLTFSKSFMFRALVGDTVSSDTFGSTIKKVKQTQENGMVCKLPSNFIRE